MIAKTYQHLSQSPDYLRAALNRAAGEPPCSAPSLGEISSTRRPIKSSPPDADSLVRSFFHAAQMVALLRRSLGPPPDRVGCIEITSAGVSTSAVVTRPTCTVGTVSRGLDPSASTERAR